MHLPNVCTIHIFVPSKAMKPESKTLTMNIQQLIIENQSKAKAIRQAAEKGASIAGYAIEVMDDGNVKYLDQESYDNQEEAINAAKQQIEHDVDL